MDKAKDQGCAALIALGARGFSFATNLILSTAAKVAHDTHCNISIVMPTIVALKWCSEVEVCIIHLYKIFYEVNYCSVLPLWKQFRVNGHLQYREDPT